MQADLFETAGLALCQRCGVECRPATQEGNPEALFLRFARRGVCASCGMTQFLKSIPVTNMLLSSGAVGRSGIPEDDQGAGGLAALRHPQIQQQLYVLMDLGHTDARPADVDWERIIAHWNLP
jgi:hypothetical protein